MKASSLFYAIVISVVIAIISGSLILFAYLSRIEFDTFQIKERLNLNAESGLNVLLSKQSIIELNKPTSIDLFSTTEDSVLLSRKMWGAFEVVISKAFFRKMQSIRIAEIGYYPEKEKAYSIYLADENKPLALSGKTKIKGTAFLPKAGVKRAIIEGQNFSGTTLIDGQIKQSETTLPSFNNDFIENIKTVFTTKKLTANDSIFTLKESILNDSLSNSFLNKSLIVYSPMNLKIASGNYTGNIAFISDKEITISADVHLKDVIIIAPKIKIEKNFKGNLQAFASDSMLLEKNITLTYPSVLGIVTNDKSPNFTAIILNENDSISGNVFVYKNELEVLKQSTIHIAEKAVITGQVYSNSIVDVKGIINGSLTCRKIMLSTPSSLYENHLLNAVIDASKLSRFYVGINLVAESKIKKVVKWLH